MTDTRGMEMMTIATVHRVPEMPRLLISDFACLDSAELSIAPLTLIIGPQASGKSIIAKLNYFITDVITDAWEVIEQDGDFSTFTKFVLDRFVSMFPSITWGKKAFQIVFEIGSQAFVIDRSRVTKNSNGRVLFRATDEFISFYNGKLDEFRLLKEKRGQKADVLYPYELSYRLRHSYGGSLQKLLGSDFVPRQTFIPAGRSFFTSMGKAVTAFEQAGMLDYHTIQFGKRFMAMREAMTRHGLVHYPHRGRDQLANELLGGQIRVERSNEYLETDDGRKIPFPFLSSGQQELLPLWLVLRRFSSREPFNELIYIEEPEAHLFPTAQIKLIRYLVGMVASDRQRKMIVTTHSPYVLAQVNNFLLAGRLGRSHKLKSKVEGLVPKQFWLRSEKVRAYAIVNRKLEPLIGEHGLIDADYLDAVSEEVAEEFSSLLGIEVP